jgi:hypothetical protein
LGPKVKSQLKGWRLINEFLGWQVGLCIISQAQIISVRMKDSPLYGLTFYFVFGFLIGISVATIA